MDLERSGRDRKKKCVWKIKQKSLENILDLGNGNMREVYKMMPRFLALIVGLMVVSVIEMTVFKYTVKKARAVIQFSIVGICVCSNFKISKSALLESCNIHGPGILVFLRNSKFRCYRSWMRFLKSGILNSFCSLTQPGSFKKNIKGKYHPHPPPRKIPVETK